LHSDDLHDLERAAALDSFDSSLQMRLARRAMEDGETQQAENAWRRAMQANPADPAPRQALLKFLIDQNRYDEAFNLIDASLKYSPKDANLLVDRGFLALQRGHADEARTSWEQAISLDPNQINAELYLADELDREGQAWKAATHYNAYLQRIARQPAQDRPAADRVIAIVLRMADCESRSSQMELAVKSYQLAERLAAQTKLTKLESVAEVNEAALQAKAGRLSEALPLYQSALKLDDSIGDYSAGAEDWLSYGRFLDQSGFSPRLAFACVVKSEAMSQALHPAGTPAPATSIQQSPIAKSLEGRLGPAAAAIRRNPRPVLAEALVLRP
jgi:tetratricopeptide (TPR) repeat protein